MHFFGCTYYKNMHFLWCIFGDFVHLLWCIGYLLVNLDMSNIMF